MIMKLGEFLKDKKQSNLEIASVEMTFTETTGEKIAILHLSTPLGIVTGSQSITDEDTNTTERVVAYDVDSIKVHESDIDDEGFDMLDNGSGKYSGNLRLDVAKSSGEVWLRSESFAAGARAFRTENRNKRNGGMVARIAERRAQAQAKQGNKAGVEPVSQP
jgi:hypothetical protein